MILMFAASAAMITVKPAKAATLLPTSWSWEPNFFVGVNSPTEIDFYPTGPLATGGSNVNLLANAPAYDQYAGTWPYWHVFPSTNTEMPNASITFKDPNGVVTVVPGPFEICPQPPGSSASIFPHFSYFWTPNVAGNWTVTFYWPGDSKYAADTVTGWINVFSQPIPQRTTIAALSINPYPDVGVGQVFLVNPWVVPAPLSALQCYHDYTLSFTAPNGTAFVYNGDSEAEGTTFQTFACDAVGNWSIYFSFPGDYASLPCSITRIITVTAASVPEGYPDTPLPTTQPLTFPINIQNRQWITIGGPWLQSYFNASHGAYNEWTTTPTTAHILWNLPAYDNTGGYIGDQGGITLDSPSYIDIQNGSGNPIFGSTFSSPITGISSGSCYSISVIMDGRGYSTSGGNITCFDIQSGQKLWSDPGASFSYGDQNGATLVLDYFNSTNFIRYDATTGAINTNVVWSPAGSGLVPNYLSYPIAITLSSSTSTTAGVYATNQFMTDWTVTGTSNSIASRVNWNITDNVPGDSNGITTPIGTTYTQLQSGVVACSDQVNMGLGISSDATYYYAFNLTNGQTVAAVYPLYNPAIPDDYLNFEGPASGSGYGLLYDASVYLGNGYLQTYFAINVLTGAVAWHSQPTDYPWGEFNAYTPDCSGDNMIFSLTYNGIYAINATNGDIVWHYIDPDYSNEVPYSSSIAGTEPNNLNLTAGQVYSSFEFGATGGTGGGAGSDSVLYAPNTEHSPTFYYRGWGLSAINCTTGQLLFKILGDYGSPVIADGVMVATDTNNGETFGFGVGNTTTTVAAANQVTTAGQGDLLSGTVLDTSTAQPNTAAVSDASMTTWMEYLHCQQPFPHNDTGVAVSLSAVDPNGNFVNIGTATSDLTGQYSIGWTPTISGLYTIVASFGGSQSYYESSAITSVYVNSAPAAAATSAPAASVINYTNAIIYAVIAIIIAMIIAVAVAILILRRRA